MAKQVKSENSCPKCGKPVVGQASYCLSCGARIFRNAKGENTDDPYLGQVVDGIFEVESVLGTGSMGIVYKARHRALDCYVALKILRHDFLVDRVALTRFQREAQAASCLSHPNVIRILHYGKTYLGAPYIAMECLNGTELGKVILEQYPFAQLRVCSIILQTARALSAAHAANIIHRDLKPANIVIVNQEGREVVKVLDFGIAKLSDPEGEGLTKEGAVCGTPAFMSPEQVLGQDITPASDLFSLGSIMYYMLTQKLPFQGTSMVDMADSILRTEPTPPSQVRLDHYVEPKLEAICMKALKKSLDERYKTANEMVADLDAAMKVIPKIDPKVKPKIIVGTIDKDTDLSGETRCGIDIYSELGKDFCANEENDEDDEGGTVVEMKAMEDDEDISTTGEVPQPVNFTQPNLLKDSFHAIKIAVAAALDCLLPRKKISPGASTIVVDVAQARGLLSEESGASKEDVLKQRKTIMLGFVCLVTAICIVGVLILLVVAWITHSSDDEVKENGSGEVAANTEPGTAGNHVVNNKLSSAQIELYCDKVRELLSDAAMTAAARGYIEGNKEEAGENANDQPDDRKEAENNESKSKPANPPKETIKRPSTPSAPPKNTTKPSASPKSDNAAAKKTSQSNKAKAAQPQSAAMNKFKEAQSLEASGQKLKACEIYNALSKDKTLEQADKLKVQNKVRACLRLKKN
ncbi:MAG: protein kinase [Proteobacteria bacterium]|nr:protein kinase [Pseudomonadota bacterium]